MTSTRRVLVWLLAGLAVLSAAALWEVLETVFFAITVVYVAAPAYRRLVERGLAPWWAGAATTALVYASVLVVFAPFAVVLYQRRGDVARFLETLPATVPVEVAGMRVVLVTGDLLDGAAALFRQVALSFAAATPVLAVKFTLFGIVVFALLVRKETVGRALLAAVPRRHRRLVRQFDERTRETLLAIYVLQAATAVGTFLVALVLFATLGYEFPLVLALLAGLLQFLPVVGPSLVVATLAGLELLAGDVQGALLVGMLGWLLVAFLPDVVVRPRLAERTADLPGSLYFVGFTGGLLTLGPVGTVAGPLVVALLHEALALLADETDAAPDGALVEES